jgi:hypothetical protein
MLPQPELYVNALMSIHSTPFWMSIFTVSLPADQKYPPNEYGVILLTLPGMLTLVMLEF